MTGERNFHIDKFEALDDPISWMEMAQTLRRGAEAIEARVLAASGEHAAMMIGHEGTGQGPDAHPILARISRDTSLARVSQMLYQMSYENALKGVLKQQHKPSSRSHDLSILAKSVGLELSNEAQEYLRLLTRMSQLGRFRIGGEKPTQLKGRTDQDGELEYKTKWSDTD
ncbi:MAG: HEPN domain-containing protein [Fimbriimonadaceae bacterium]